MYRGMYVGMYVGMYGTHWISLDFLTKVRSGSSSISGSRSIFGSRSKPESRA